MAQDPQHQLPVAQYTASQDSVCSWMPQGGSEAAHGKGEGEGLAACGQGEGKLPLTWTCYSFQMNHLFFFSLNYEQYGEIESNHVWSNSFPPSPSAVALWGLLSQPAEAEEGRNKDTKGHQYREHEAAVVRGIGVWCAWA